MSKINILQYAAKYMHEDGDVLWCSGSKYHPEWTSETRSIRLFRRYSDAAAVVNEQALRWPRGAYEVVAVECVLQ